MIKEIFKLMMNKKKTTPVKFLSDSENDDDLEYDSFENENGNEDSKLLSDSNTVADDINAKSAKVTTFNGLMSCAAYSACSCSMV